MCCHKKEISAVQLNFNLDINLFNVTIYYLNFIKVLFGLGFKKFELGASQLTEHSINYKLIIYTTYIQTLPTVTVH